MVYYRRYVVHVLCNEPLQGKNTLALKASASAFARVTTDAELRAALDWAIRREKNVIPLGQGSNIVLAGDLDALILQQCQRGITVVDDNGETIVIRVAGGENWHSLVEWTLAQGYYGLENLALIPGTVGAAPIQNIGAYGVELSPFVHSVAAVLTTSGETLHLTGKECEFSYRDSIFKGILRDKVIITSVELSLSRLPRQQISYPALQHHFLTNAISNPTPQDIFNTVVDIRQSKLPDPALTPNAGSFFKNPIVSEEKLEALRVHYCGIAAYPQKGGRVKISAAWLIDRCGWKGRQCGDFGVHPRHALVLVNYGGDDGMKLLALAREIHSTVAAKFGIELEIEPRVYGLE